MRAILLPGKKKKTENFEFKSKRILKLTCNKLELCPRTCNVQEI